VKNKIIFLATFVLLTCGCSTEVNLNITSDYINEEIVISDNATLSITKDEIKQEYRNYVPVYKDSEIYDEDPDEEAEGIEYYKRNLVEFSDGYKFTYSYNFPIKKYKNAASINYAFRSFSIIKDEENGTLTIMTDSNGLMYFNQYPRLDSLKINITTDMEVIETNGTLEHGTYTWEFYENDYKKGVYIEMKLPTSEEEVIENPSNIKEDNVEDSSNLGKAIILFLGFFVVLIVVIILTKFSKK
jgi:hypothetical protein